MPRTPLDSPLLATVLAAQMTLACAPAGPGGGDAADPPDAAHGGWIVLFDGRRPEQLRGYLRQGFPEAGWRVEDGALKTVVGGDRVDLVTREEFESFELALEWRVSPGGNSGVFYHVAEGPAQAWETGAEIQILDDAGHPDGRDPRTSAGALYGLVAPVDKQLRPPGEFNQLLLRVEGSRVEHWLNGVRVCRYELGSAELLGLIAHSKFKDLPQFLQQRRGRIGLQHHGEEVWFRDIRVRRLT